jgi:hypothetical protein
LRAISPVVTKRDGSVVARRLPDLVQRCVWKPDEIVLSGENAQTNVLSRQQVGDEDRSCGLAMILVQ